MPTTQRKESGARENAGEDDDEFGGVSAEDGVLEDFEFFFRFFPISYS